MKASHFVIGLSEPTGQRIRPRPSQAPARCSRLPLTTPGALLFAVQYSAARSCSDSAISRPRRRIGGERDEIAPTRFDRLHRPTFSFYTPPDALLETRQDLYCTTAAFQTHRTI
ncbi:hypothetical protein IQ06DRAFT_107474 [Phaeosphaeriaceae sp. SRC1lsM3a]|nr:hypothetical protein IQ06DRAFT_107474 [Stagonospora sp. SRC1lsM3a]